MAVLKTEHILLLGVGAVLLYLSRFKERLIDKLSKFIPSVESFSAKPYWDVTRYSWGYGTAAPGNTGTITREKAFTDMIAYLMADYGVLKARITRRLSVDQWVAYLSFSYNLGIGNALNLVPLINAGDWQALGVKWNQYVYADGDRLQVLVDRRRDEWALFSS